MRVANPVYIPGEVMPMTAMISRRGLLHRGAGTAAALGASTLAGELGTTSGLVQEKPKARRSRTSPCPIDRASHNHEQRHP
jgi:hypothetical protein